MNTMMIRKLATFFLMTACSLAVFTNHSLGQNKSSFSLSNQVDVRVANGKEPFEHLMADFLTDDLKKVFGESKSESRIQKVILRIVKEQAEGIDAKMLASIDKDLANKWEVFSYKNYENKGVKYLIISGSNKRGLAYGVFTLSEKIGVSPWYFWADVPVKKQLTSFAVSDTLSQEPSVKYRGIFINDEDWGLQPWAAKTFETATKDIGPKTYAKVFELLLRLKANLIWPAMHPSTKAFYHYPDNKLVAHQYAIVVGTSHAEPMMRNNVDEWIDSTMGDYNYLTNKNRILDYWTKRIEEIKDFENLYSIGMRGKHDSGMEGIKTKSEAVSLTNRIIGDERNLLSKLLNKPKESVPQVLTLYKEVLELYKEGLNVPEDVTLIWPDDNYGYVKSLSNEQERKRSGGAGVYYHASYWGRPHDYLWIGTTDPTLMRFEMQKSYELGANKVWVVNVGDIKPLEYPTQLFLDMAYNMKPFLKNESVFKHLENWTLTNLGNKEVASILMKNYDLSFVRKPEFMGWSKVEPTIQTKPTSFSPAEIAQRMGDFQQLEKQVNDNEPRDKTYESSYFQLVKYPVLAASKMNQKFLNLDLFYTNPVNERTEQDPNFQGALSAYQAIQDLTQTYNQQVSGGKWNHIMSMKPRNLPVFKSPVELKNVEQKKVTTPTSSLSIPAGAYTRMVSTPSAYWEKIAEPSFSKNALVARPFTLANSLENGSANQPTVEYEVELSESKLYTLKVQAIPLHPLNRKLGQKIAIQLDNNETQVIDFETFDRSDEWKENVLSNKSIKSLKAVNLEKGKHLIRLKMIDPGVLIDRLIID